MHDPEFVGPPPHRMILALTAFLGGIAWGIWYLALRVEPPAPRAQPTATAPSKDDGRLFYDSIGRTPASQGGDQAAASPAAGPVSYTLELGVTDRREEAERQIDDLARRGVESYYTPLSRQGQVIYRVRHGIYGSQQAAQQAAQTLAQSQRLGAKVVKLQ